MSGSSMPIDLWASIIELIDVYAKSITADQKFIRSSVVDQLKNINIHVDNSSREKFNDSIKTLIKRDKGGVLDSNHSLGFGCDVFLKRSLSNGKTGYACLYEPHDDKDFEIIRYFTDCCFKLGASSVGAGIFYMDYPSLKKYYYNTKEPKYKQGLKNFNGRNILRDKVPLRNSDKHGKRNALHVDISQFNNQVHSIIENEQFGKIARYVQEYENIKNQMLGHGRTFKGVAARQEGRFFKLKELQKGSVSKYKGKIISRTSHPGRKSVWGRDGKSRYAESWLLSLANRKASASKAYNIKQITSENYTNIVFEAFKDKTHRKADKKHGNEEWWNYVEEKDILK
jgi:hypothetical protein